MPDGPIASTRPMTRDEARAFRERWAMVNERERELLRAMTPTEKLRQVAAMMGWAKAMGWTEKLAAEKAQVRERWMRLREAYHDRERPPGALPAGPGEPL